MPTILLICGGPGSGKTTLAQALVAQLHGSHLISFDDEEERGVQFDPDQWHIGRNRSLAALRDTLKQKQVIIMDDTFHLRSMRKQIHQIARESGAVVASVCLRISLDLQHSRNALRPPETRVPDSVLDSVTERMEGPDPSFESLWTEASAGSLDEHVSIALDMIARAQTVAPLPPLPTASEVEAEASRRVRWWIPLHPTQAAAQAHTQASRLHRADNYLRAKVRGAVDAGVDGRSASEKRRQILLLLRKTEEIDYDEKWLDQQWNVK